MPPPVSTLTLGGTDISAYVSEDAGEVVRWGRGANFEGRQEAPGWLTAIVQNPDRRFNPLNSGSPILAQLKFGKKVRLTAVHSATTYYLFDGFLRHIFLRDDGFAEIHAQDALYNVGRRETSLVNSFTRSIRQFRTDILADIGVTSLNLASGNGGESMIGYTGADQRNVLELLTELNKATGTVHFIKPTAAGYDYTTLDRLYFQGAASVEDWLDTDLSQPFAESLGSTDYNDERIINHQRVRATPRDLLDPEELWRRNRIVVSAGDSENFWGWWDDPAVDLTITYDSVGGTPASLVLTPFTRSAKLAITAGGTAVDLRDVVIKGSPARERGTSTKDAEDATSISTYGRLRGEEIESEYLTNDAQARGLASYIVWRHKDAHLVPPVRFVNRFPTQLARDVGDVVRMTSAELSATLARFVIRSHENAISEKGAHWATTYSLEALPPALDLFTIGGTAGQGIGGTGILGY